MTRPRSFGRFQVLSILGRGGMGTVYLAEDPIIRRRVAIKEILVDPTGGTEQRAKQYERFVHECRSAGALSHPNIVTVYDVGQVEGAYFIALELVPGESLAQRLRREPRPPRSWVIDTARQVADGLDHAHRLGVLHRDVKPGNILLGEDKQVKLTDFGIAKLLEADRNQPATVVGTPGYMSPEQVRGRAIDGRSDQFSLAVLIYQMLVGIPPYRGDSMSEVIYRLLHEPPKAPSLCHADLPKKLDRALLQGLARDPADRFSSCRSMVDAVARGLRQPPSEPTPPFLDEALTLPIGASPERTAGRRRRLTWLAAAGVTLAVALFLALSPRFAGSGSNLKSAPAKVQAGAEPAAAFEPEASSGEVDGAAEAGQSSEPPAEGAPVVDTSPSVSLRVTSDPAGAAVFLGGVATGQTTPATVDFEPALTHHLEIRLDGYPPVGWRFSLDDLSERQRTEGQLHFPLVPRGPRSTLVVSADYPVEVVVGGRRHGLATRHEIALPIGRHEVRLLSVEHFLDRTVPLNLQPGERTPLKAPAAVTVRLAARPGNCEVTVGGRTLSERLPLTLRIAAGRHTFVFSWPDGRSRRIATAVTEGQRVFATPP